MECISEYVGYNEWKPENKLDNLLKNTSLPIEFDILSIDVDGPDYFILRDMKIYKPKILILEYNSFDIGKEYIIYKKGHTHKKIQIWEFKLFHHDRYGNKKRIYACCEFK